MASASDVKNDRKYTADHEWAQKAGSEVLIGVTAFAVDQLGDITLVNLNVKPGDPVTRGKTFGTIESVKTLSDLFAPLSGTIARINPALENSPELINEDPWTKGWMVAIKPAALESEWEELLDAQGYQQKLQESKH